MQGGTPLPGYGSKMEAVNAITTYKPGMMMGTIKFINPEKGFGFIVPDVPDDNGQVMDVFVHQDDIVTPNKLLAKGEAVSYTVGVKKEGGKVQAMNVSSMTPAAPGFPGQPAYGQQAPMDLYAQQAQAYAYAQAQAQAGGPMPPSAYDPYAQQAPQAPQAADPYSMAAAAAGEWTGTVKWFNESKGFGFLLPSNGGGDVYFKNIEGAGPLPQTGEAVKFAVQAMGSRQQAVNVTRVGGVKRKADQAPDGSDGKRAQYMYAQQPADQMYSQSMLQYPDYGQAPAPAPY